MNARRALVCVYTAEAAPTLLSLCFLCCQLSKPPIYSSYQSPSIYLRNAISTSTMHFLAAMITALATVAVAAPIQMITRSNPQIANLQNQLAAAMAEWDTWNQIGLTDVANGNIPASE